MDANADSNAGEIPVRQHLAEDPRPLDQEISGIMQTAGVVSAIPQLESAMAGVGIDTTNSAAGSAADGGAGAEADSTAAVLIAVLQMDLWSALFLRTMFGCQVAGASTRPRLLQQ